MKKHKKILIITGAARPTGQIIEKHLNKKYQVKLIETFSIKESIKVIFSQFLKKYDKIINITTGKNAFSWISIIFIRRNELVFFPYDISHFYPREKKILNKIHQQMELIIEKINFFRSDKIIHKGLKEELTFLPFYEKIKHKPEHLFREFIIKKDFLKKEDFLSKLSERDGEIHLVYAGVVHTTNDFFHERTTNLFKRIITKKVHLHVYSRPNKYLKELEKNKYFNYEGFVPHEQLIKKLQKYDFGLYFYGRTDNKFGANGTNIWDKTGFSNKIYDYIKAGIPILYSNNIQAICECLDGSGLGIKQDYSEFNFGRLKRMNFQTYNKNRIKFINKLSNKDLIMFLRKKNE